MSIGPLFRTLKTSSRTQAWLAAIVVIVVLILRKTWALHTPQLWAEDGSIHLNDVDRAGFGAIWIPYRGYLHVVPRLITLAAAHLTDVANWPLAYNLGAGLFAAILIVRLASPRFELPGKPWLILAFGLMPYDNVTLFNITNLHWLLGLFLVQQFLIASPTTWTQRLGDALLICCAGLSDPSALIFLPLFVWRWWRERSRDNLLVLALVAACALVQGYFLRQEGLGVDGNNPPFQWVQFLAAAGNRLVIWPFFGRAAAIGWPAAVQAAVATVFVVCLFGWVCRRDEHRPLRLKILAAWLLISFACVYRTRPDTWAGRWHAGLENLSFSEPYLFASRLLLVWLVILELNARARIVAWLARVACVAAVLMELPHYHEAPPTNYHWAENCAPIREGIKANIPILPDGWILQYPGRPPKR